MTHMQRWCSFLVCNTGKGTLDWYNGNFQPLLTMTCFNSAPSDPYFPDASHSLYLRLLGSIVAKAIFWFSLPSHSQSFSLPVSRESILQNLPQLTWVSHPALHAKHSRQTLRWICGKQIQRSHPLSSSSPNTVCSILGCFLDWWHRTRKYVLVLIV